MFLLTCTVFRIWSQQYERWTRLKTRAQVKKNWTGSVFSFFFGFVHGVSVFRLLLTEHSHCCVGTKSE